jgi:hypothetical protein
VGQSEVSDKVQTPGWELERKVTLPTFIAALALVATLVSLWMSRSNTITQLRAYVVVSDVTLSDLPGFPGHYVFNCKLKNVGSTPAHRVVTNIACGIGWDKFGRGELLRTHAGPDLGEMASADIDLAPGGEIEISRTLKAVLELPYLLEQFRAGFSKGTALWIVGDATYEDVFEHSRKTTFRYRQIDTTIKRPPKLDQVGGGNKIY